MRATKILFENQHNLGYVQGITVKDHYLKLADVYNIKLELDKETWRVMLMIKLVNDKIMVESESISS